MPAWARAALTGVVVLAACGPAVDRPGGALVELESLAFVPPGECRLLARDGADIVCATEHALLVDRWEVPVSTWRAFLAGADLPPAPARDAIAAAWPDALDVWPASGMNLEEARALAAWRGMRLPTAREWIRVAAGTRASPWPWGSSRASSVANTVELRLDRPVPVGTFEHGQSPESVYDLIGNVAEWVEEPIAAAAGVDLGVTPAAWALGGSYATRLWKTYDYDRVGRLVVPHLDLDPRTRAADVGLRCVADARAWLTAHAGDLGQGEAARQRLAAVGARWGRGAVPLLEELAARPGAPAAFVALLEGARR